MKEIFLFFSRTKTKSDMVLKILEANAHSLFVFPKYVSVFNFMLFLLERGVAKAWTHYKNINRLSLL